MDNSESTTKQTKGKIGMKVYKHIFHLTHWSELVKGNHISMPYPIPDLREHNHMGVERKKHNHCHQHLQTVGFFLLYREYQETHTKTFKNIQLLWPWGLSSCGDVWAWDPFFGSHSHQKSWRHALGTATSFAFSPQLYQLEPKSFGTCR